ncbi:MAG: GNAT family N-acetyltransferase [Alphaproteobacteria bacterium]|nr:GNAT family N-acetyltransferase [Alphaproteobacteria bacterium]
MGNPDHSESVKSADLRLGTLLVRLAHDKHEIEVAQRLRYKVFYEEMHAEASPEMAAAKRDFDDLDNFCDHLLVLDTAKKGDEAIIGTYRLVRRCHADKYGKFYSSDEYDIGKLVSYPGEILELGRSCVATEYRSRPIMQLMWRGLAAYVFQYDIAIMFGCASFPGTDPQQHAAALSYLHYHHLAPPGIRPKALPERYVNMRILPPEAFDASTMADDLKLDPRSGANNLPPLIKGYLRVGGYVGDGAVVDTQFNTTDVCIIVKTDLLTDRYLRHYERKVRDVPLV